MDPSRVIHDYESLAKLTGQMRTAADRGEWDRLIELEQQCTQLIEQMKSADDGTLADEATRRQIISLIRKIQDDDSIVRKQTERWMAQLQNIIKSNAQEQRLNKTYGAAG